MPVGFRWRALWLSIACLCLVGESLNAETRSVPTCEAAVVQSAINAASSGDVLQVAPGRCQWSNAVIIPAGKQITVQGSGAGSTIIDATATGKALHMAVGASRVTGFTFLCGFVQVDGDGWRIDHNTFTCGTFQEGVYVRGSRKTQSPKGLIDHNTFINRRVEVQGYPAVTLSELDGSNQWSAPLALGTDQAVYIEDNSFSFSVFGNVVDCEYGGGYVFRNNSVTDAYLEAHSVQGTNRACRKWEIYNNTITQSTVAVYRAMLLRGGTGVAFNNTIKGHFDAGPVIVVDNVRSYQSAGPTFGKCDGTSKWDGNAETNGWPCLDQIGRGGDPAPFNGVPQSQTIEPAYFWNNTFDGVLGSIRVDNGATVHVHADRDYFVNKGSKPGYTPYQYPHPLASSPPAAPQGLRIVTTR